MSVTEITETRQYLTFKLSDEVFAIDVAKVREVLDFTTITKVPRTPDFNAALTEGAGLWQVTIKDGVRVSSSSAYLRPVRSRLTPREWEVLDLLCDGLDTAAIADTLVLSPETVNSHIKSVKRKLGARTRKEAVEATRRLRAELILAETSGP